MTTNEQLPDDQAYWDEATAWHARLKDDAASEQDWLAFTAWLEADPKNRLVYDQVEEISNEIDRSRTGIAEALARSERDAPISGTVIPLHGKTRPSGMRWYVGMGLIAATLLVVVLGRNLLEAPSVDFQTYKTAMGQHQDVTLADGSLLHLNTGTELSVAMAAGERQVHFDHGEALFEVAKDSSRPFIITSGDQTIRVVGTVFNVLRHRGKVAVTVAEGVVQVAPVKNADANWQPVRLTMGDQLTRQEGSPRYDLKSVDLANALAWRDGRLSYDDVPLSQVIDDLNRYFPETVSAAGDDVASLRFSGVLKLDDEMSVLRRLENFLPVSIEQTGDKFLLRKRQSAS